MRYAPFLLAAALTAVACSDDETSTTSTSATTSATTSTSASTSGAGGATSSSTSGTGGGGTCNDPPFVAVAEDAGPYIGIFRYVAQTTLGDPVDVLYFELVNGAPAVGTLPITNAGYDSCEQCVLVYKGCDGNLANCSQVFLAQGGSLVVTSSGDSGATFAGTLEGAELVEVTIDENFVSTPVANGESMCWDSYSFSATIQ